MTSLYTIDENQDIQFYQHPGQKRAWKSRKRIPSIFAGSQSGKTVWMSWWLWREIVLTAISGEQNDYLAVTATYDLFKLKLLPTMREVFERVLAIGRYWSGDRIIELCDPETGRFWAKRVDDPMWGRIILRSAESESGLESATAKAAIFDEAGIPSVSVDVYWALRRRLALHQGRMCIGTTLYDLGWLKAEIYDPWEKSGRNHDEIDVIQFDSIENPSFPQEEFDRAKAILPQWKFDMMYRGVYTRPAGLVYESFDEGDIVESFPIPEDWERYVGLDFGAINTVAVFFARKPETNEYYLYREYAESSKPARDHVANILADEPRPPICFGGAASEDQWRREFGTAGLFINEPKIKEVDVGITRVYVMHSTRRIKVMRHCVRYLEQKRTYRYKVDAYGQSLLTIQDKETFHFMDAERYIVSHIFEPTGIYAAMRVFKDRTAKKAV